MMNSTSGRGCVTRHLLSSAAPVAAIAAIALLAAAPARAQAGAPFLSLPGPGSGHIEVAHDPALNPTGAITVEAWVFMQSWAARGAFDYFPSIVGKGYSTAYWLGVCSGHPRFYARGTASWKDASGTVPLDIWTHVAATSDGSTVKFYINGVLDSTAALTPGALGTNTSPVMIGSDANWDASPKGFIDEVRIWNVARSQSDIAATMNTAITSAQPGLVAAFGLNGSPNATFGGFTGTVVGNAAFSSETSPFPCGVSYFVPTGGHLPGAGTPPTQWRTDISLLNTGDATADVLVQLLKRDNDNSNPLAVGATVPSNNSVAMPDVVLSSFHFDNLAAAFRVCSDKPLLVTSRTYNQAATGTFGQSVMGYTPAQAIPDSSKAYLGGLYQHAGLMRTNVGFVNGGATPITVTVDFFAANGTALGTITYGPIPSYGYIQRNHIFTEVTASDVANGWLKVHVFGGTGFAWATVIDEATGDSSFYLAQ
jgi:hypothetical protein